jgi:hypothetical protein
MIFLFFVFLLSSFAGIQAQDTCAPDGEYFYYTFETSNVIFDFVFEASRITLKVSRVISLFSLDNYVDRGLNGDPKLRLSLKKTYSEILKKKIYFSATDCGPNGIAYTFENGNIFCFL